MTAPRLTFTPLQGHEPRRYVAFLGKAPVGSISDDLWTPYLPPRAGWRRAESHDAAKRALIADVNGWLREAGLQQIEGTDQ